MSRLKWCYECRENVYPYKKFSIVGFLFLLVVPYLFYFLFMKKKECPFCGSRRFGRRRVFGTKQAK